MPHNGELFPINHLNGNTQIAQINDKILTLQIFTKLLVTVYGKEQPPIDVKLRLQGPWVDGVNV